MSYRRRRSGWRTRSQCHPSPHHASYAAAAAVGAAAFGTTAFRAPTTTTVMYRRRSRSRHGCVRTADGGQSPDITAASAAVILPRPLTHRRRRGRRIFAATGRRNFAGTGWATRSTPGCVGGVVLLLSGSIGMSRGEARSRAWRVRRRGWRGS
jgi:hypothetical protein